MKKSGQNGRQQASTTDDIEDNAPLDTLAFNLPVAIPGELPAMCMVSPAKHASSQWWRTQHTMWIVPADPTVADAAFSCDLAVSGFSWALGRNIALSM